MTTYNDPRITYSGSRGVTPTGFVPVPRISGDATPTLQGMLDTLAGTRGVLGLGPFEYSVTGLSVPSGVTIQGMGMDNSGLKLAANSNNHVISCVNADQVSLRDFYIDGNKSAQSIGSGNNWRGVYFTKTDSSTHGYHHFVRLKVKDTVDHGVMFSSTGEYSVFDSCIATGCGSQAHLDAGGAGGTGFTGYTDTTFISCRGEGNRLNGFKSDRATYIHCISKSNGGGFETGFNASAGTRATYIGCWALDCDGGFRHQGEGDQITMIGGGSVGCASSGMTILNAVDNIRVIGAQFRNNGKGTGIYGTYSRTSTVGMDGISILSSGSTGPTSVDIDHCDFIDDQGSPTQDYGIYLDDNMARVRIGSGNEASGNLSGPLYLSGGATDETIRIEGFTGYAGESSDVTSTSVTGTTSATDLKSVTFPAYSLHIGSVIRIRVGGTITGTAGTKTVRIQLGATSRIISSQTSGEEQDWFADITIAIRGTRHVMTSIASENGGTSATNVDWATNSLTSSLVFKVTGTLGDAADTITQNLLSVTTER